MFTIPAHKQTSAAAAPAQFSVSAAAATEIATKVASKISADLGASRWDHLDDDGGRIRRSRVAKVRRSTDRGMRELERERDIGRRAARSIKRDFA